jgi:Trypsin
VNGPVRRAILMVGLLAPTAAMAQTKGPPPEAPGVVYDGFRASPPAPALGADTQIIGGQKANLEKWPASMKFEAGSTECTATVVGPTTILTAAHCLPAKPYGVITLNGVDVKAGCRPHPLYGKLADGASKYDVALCGALAQLTLPAAAAFETINVNAARPAKTDQMKLLGYGCLSAKGKPIKTLFEGDTWVEERKTPPPIIIAKGGAAVCAGDSGGAAFVFSGLSRAIGGVASQAPVKEGEISRLTDLSDPAIQSFLTDWGSPICGIADYKTKCHG